MEDQTTGSQHIKELTSQQIYWNRYLHEYWNHWDYEWRSNEESHGELGAKNVKRLEWKPQNLVEGCKEKMEI